ncbi:MAG: hypothetical protein AVDCRST_MAG85-1025, partial [uncultured Solirubrobacteraceae bacterium]
QGAAAAAPAGAHHHRGRDGLAAADAREPAQQRLDPRGGPCGAGDGADERVRARAGAGAGARHAGAASAGRAAVRRRRNLRAAVLLPRPVRRGGHVRPRALLRQRDAGSRPARRPGPAPRHPPPHDAHLPDPDRQRLGDADLRGRV